MIFKDIPFSNAKASMCGKILSHKGKILKQIPDIQGYYRTKVDGKTKLIHRLVALAWIPNPLNLPEVNHLDGDKSNNTMTNLEWCTHDENVSHAKATKLLQFGIRNGNSLLDEIQVKTIHKCCSEKIPVLSLAKYFKIKKGTIYSILRRDNWAHIDLPKIELPKIGETWCRSKLKNIDVLIIREAIKNGHKVSRIASYYNVSTENIYNIKNGKRWGSIQ